MTSTNKANFTISSDDLSKLLEAEAALKTMFSAVASPVSVNEISFEIDLDNLVLENSCEATNLQEACDMVDELLNYFAIINFKVIKNEAPRPN